MKILNGDFIKTGLFTILITVGLAQKAMEPNPQAGNNNPPVQAQGNENNQPRNQQNNLVNNPQPAEQPLDRRTWHFTLRNRNGLKNRLIQDEGFERLEINIPNQNHRIEALFLDRGQRAKATLVCFAGPNKKEFFAPLVKIAPQNCNLLFVATTHVYHINAAIGATAQKTQNKPQILLCQGINASLPTEALTELQQTQDFSKLKIKGIIFDSILISRPPSSMLRALWNKVTSLVGSLFKSNQQTSILHSIQQILDRFPIGIIHAMDDNTSPYNGIKILIQILAKAIDHSVFKDWFMLIPSGESQHTKHHYRQPKKYKKYLENFIKKALNSPSQNQSNIAPPLTDANYKPYNINAKPWNAPASKAKKKKKEQNKPNKRRNAGRSGGGKKGLEPPNSDSNSSGLSPSSNGSHNSGGRPYRSAPRNYGYNNRRGYPRRNGSMGARGSHSPNNFGRRNQGFQKKEKKEEDNITITAGDVFEIYDGYNDDEIEDRPEQTTLQPAHYHIRNQYRQNRQKNYPPRRPQGHYTRPIRNMRPQPPMTMQQMVKPPQKIRDKKIKNVSRPTKPIKKVKQKSSYTWVGSLMNGYLMSPVLGVAGSIISSVVDLVI